MRSTVIAALLLSACVLQPPAHTPLPPLPAAWDQGSAGAPAGTAAAGRWWRALGDPGVDALVVAAERAAPTVDQALARVEQARATLAGADATVLPQVVANPNITRATSTASLPILLENTASAAFNLSWEIDLFGRRRHGIAAARDRIDAARADARLARLSLETELVDTVLLRRACGLLLERQRESVASSERTLTLSGYKRDAGILSPLELARSRSAAGEIRASLLATEGDCAQYSQTLSFLAGLPSADVEAVLAGPEADRLPQLPQAPPLHTELPAAVLQGHPALQSALRAADAAYEEIGEARAARLPSLTLNGLLAKSRIQIAGLDQRVNNWSLGAALSGPVYDGGASGSQVSAALGRYHEALATLSQTLRSTVRDVERALLQGRTAERQLTQAQQTLAAAQVLFDASDAAQRVGRLSNFDLETARTALLSAQSSVINARRDQARAWVALIKATASPGGSDDIAAAGMPPAPETDSKP